MKVKKYQILFFALLLAGVMVCGWALSDRGSIKAEATQTNGAGTNDAAQVGKVKPIEVDYDSMWLKVDANGNTKVYYSDKSKKVWYEAKKAKEKNDTKEYYYIDISWLSNTKESEINLKGDINEEIFSVTFPARDSKIKAKYDKANTWITFENISSDIKKFEWRKATSYTWNEGSIVDGKSDKKFQEELKKLSISGASIYVRIPQTKGKLEIKTGTDSSTTTEEFNPGVRQSKEIKISITKLAAAPKVTIDGTKLLLNTKATMEYFIGTGDPEDPKAAWKPAEAKMEISKITSEVLYQYNADGTTSSTPKPVDILIRTKATDKKAASKSFLLTIPAQRPQPMVVYGTNATAAVTWELKDSKVYLTFAKASKTEPYEYMVAKPGTSKPDFTKGWKAVTSAKTISLSLKTVQPGSTIYIRKKTIKANTKTNTKFEIASAYNKIEIPSSIQ